MMPTVPACASCVASSTSFWSWHRQRGTVRRVPECGEDDEWLLLVAGPRIRAQKLGRVEHDALRP